MPFKITSVMALATLVGAAAAAASRPMTTNEDPAGARRLTGSFEAVGSGCYTDGPNPRFMGNPVVSDSTEMSTELCASICSDIPASKFFGTQYGQECFCGDQSTNFEYYGSSDDCDYECPGDTQEVCGGFWAMSLYNYTGQPTTPTPVSPAPVGPSLATPVPTPAPVGPPVLTTPAPVDGNS